MFYRERMEVEGTLLANCTQLFARDAYNGRLLWTLVEVKKGNAALGEMSADDKGRLFVVTPDGKYVCLDAATGKLRFVLIDKDVWTGTTSYCRDDLIFVGNKVFSAVDGKFIRNHSLDGYSPIADSDSYYTCDGTTLTESKCTDNAVIKTVKLDPPLPAQTKEQANNLGVLVAGKRLILEPREWLGGVDSTWFGGKFHAYDVDTGKAAWTYAMSKAMAARPFVHHYGTVRVTVDRDKIYILRRYREEGKVLLSRLDAATGKIEEEDKIVKVPGWGGWCFGRVPMYLGDYIAYHDVWIDKRTMEVTPTARVNGACFTGPVPSKDMGLIYNFPSRKSNQISAIGPADPAVSPAPGSWKSLQRFGAPTSADPTREDDWPMFRGGPGRGNAGKAAVGDKPVKAWETAIGLGGRSYGVMCGERTGLTQPVSAYGLVIVSDLEGRRIVAVDAADGKQKWVFHVGSRVDYPPALYRGLCLFAAADGWVYCLDAKTGALVWKNMFAERERYAGGRDALESTAPTPWSTLPINSDRGAGKRLTPGPRVNVMVVNGVGYLDNLAFKPETGDAVPAPGKLAVGRQFGSVRPNWLDVDALLDVGNSPVRALEDRGGQVFTDGRAQGRVVSFDDALSVAYQSPGGEDPSCGGSKLALNAAGNAKWSVPIEMIVDDVVVTPARLYCVGHYQRIKKDPELWVVSREDGKVLGTVPVEGFPVFFGMSAAGNRLFVSTREGKLICYESK